MLIPGIGAEVGLPLLGTETARKALILAGATVGKVAAFGDKGSIFIAIDGDLQLFTETFAEFVSILNNFVHSDIGHGDEGAYIGGTLTRVGTVVLAHVDEFGCLLDNLVGGLENRLGFTDEGDDGAVGGLAGVDVEEFHTLDLLNLGSHLIDDIHIAPFADIGHTFNKLLHLAEYLVFCKDTFFFGIGKYFF